MNPYAFRRHPLKMVCLPISPLPHGGEPYKYSKDNVRRESGRKRHIGTVRRLWRLHFGCAEALHPAREGLLVQRTGGVGVAHVAALLGLAILA